MQGSGFIAFPPQRRFEKPLLVQPPTISHIDHPEEWKGVAPPPVAGGSQLPRAGPPPNSAPQYRPPVNAQAPPQQYATRPPAQNGVVPQPRPYQAPHGSAAAAAAAAAAATAAVAPQFRQPQPQPQARAPAPSQARPAQYAPAAPAPAAHSRAPITTASRPAPRPSAPAPVPAPVSVPRPAAPTHQIANLSVKDDDDDDDDDNAGGLTKAQKKRLRKKLREGAK